MLDINGPRPVPPREGGNALDDLLAGLFLRVPNEEGKTGSTEIGDDGYISSIGVVAIGEDKAGEGFLDRLASSKGRGGRGAVGAGKLGWLCV